MEPLIITLPDWHAFGRQDWTILIVFVNAIYGYITHLHSLPAIRRYNKTEKVKNIKVSPWSRKVTEGTICGIFLVRIFLGLPVRIFWSLFVLIALVFMLVATGRVSFNLLDRLQWHMTPEELSTFF